MERLTKRLSNGNASWNYPIICFGEDDSKNKVFKSVHRQKACEKLAAYEETGLEPEELAQAKKEGRLVVRPCKVGDKVLVDVRTFPYNYLHPMDGCRDYAKCEIVSIVTTKKETYMKLRALYPSRARKQEYLRYGVTAIGKTVFLTREAAEAALEEREADHDR